MSLNNVVNQEYQATGTSKSLNELGMREMQARAYEKKDSQYLLLKSPPASGKSRALMFLGLDKLKHQGIKKVVVAVPEMSIGRSFKSTQLMKNGFFADWIVDDRYNLCLLEHQSDMRKTSLFKEFMTTDLPADTSPILICTHATFRYGMSGLLEEGYDPDIFDDTLVGIDEFHHVSAEDSNVLGSLLDKIMKKSTAHVVAMTGSYFRGDTVPILSSEDEAKFDRVTYTYYEQLNGYDYLKTLGIGYHFYSKSYFDALPECLDTNLKTIIYIPNVNSAQAEFDKYETANRVMDIIGTIVEEDLENGLCHIKTSDGRILKVADLVDDDKNRRNTQSYLAKIDSPDDVDIIIALGMAKEGFDWEYCEHVLTVGYRNSLTEVVQIIGRATRDSEGKEHAQFTNLISVPDASKEDTSQAVNNILKAISLSLLMEQVLKPKVNFRSRNDGAGPTKKGDIHLKGPNGEDASKAVVDFLNKTKDEIKEDLINNTDNIKEYVAAGENNEDASNVSDNVLVQIIKDKGPHLSDEDVFIAVEAIKKEIASNHLGGVYGAEDLSDNDKVEGEKTYVEKDGKYSPVESLSDEEKAKLDKKNIIKERHIPSYSKIYDPITGEETEKEPGDAFVKVANKFINASKLPINLIDSVNPFHNAYEVISKTLDKDTLLNISDSVRATRSNVTEEEVLTMWHKVREFIKKNNRRPDIRSSDPTEVRLAEIVEYARVKKAKSGV